MVFVSYKHIYKVVAWNWESSWNRAWFIFIRGVCTRQTWMPISCMIEYTRTPIQLIDNSNTHAGIISDDRSWNYFWYRNLRRSMGFLKKQQHPPPPKKRKKKRTTTKKTKNNKKPPKTNKTKTNNNNNNNKPNQTKLNTPKQNKQTNKQKNMYIPRSYSAKRSK